ncbi:hypothetical protein BH11PLA1_BH11PLA1_11440 [soil metagenome]
MRNSRGERKDPKDFKVRPDRSTQFGRPLLAPGVRIVHEDADLLIIDKPTGLVTAAGPDEPRETLFDAVKEYIRGGKDGKGGARSRQKTRDAEAADADAGTSEKRFAGIIHRLDREASGLLVFTKTERAYHWLKDDFKSKRVHRHYLVLVEGEVGKVGEQSTIQSFLKETREGGVHSIEPDEFRGGGGQQTGFGEEHDQARPAVTHYKVLGTGGGYSLLQVRLETGRKHQIRAHMLERKHPVVGDRKYGARTDPLRRLCLHAAELGFVHPGTGESVRFKSEAPTGFYTLAKMAIPAPTQLRGPTPGTPAAPVRDSDDTSWQNVAGWYDQLIGEKRSDHYDNVIVPGTLRLVQPSAGQRILDIACGQGVVSRELARLGASVVAVDAAEKLIEAAKKRGEKSGAGQIDYRVADARALEALGLEENSFDSAACVMALANVNPLEPLFAQAARLLKTGGRFVFSITHPAFRAADQTSWGWDESQRRQYRRVDGYLSAGQKAIQMHPGAAPDITTWTFHRPLQTYVRLLADSGLMVDALEEWPALRVSEPGPRAEAENRARREIPLFLAVRAVKVGSAV